MKAESGDPACRGGTPLKISSGLPLKWRPACDLDHSTFDRKMLSTNFLQFRSGEPARPVKT